MSLGSSHHPADGRPVYLCDGVLVHKCILADSFEGGATVHLDPSCASLPSGVVLVDPRTCYSHVATVVWRSDAEIGIHFVQKGARYRVLRSPADLAWNADVPNRRAS